MAAVVRRVSSSIGSIASRPLLTPKQITKPQVSGLVSKMLRDPDFQRPYAFPYKERTYGIIAAAFDETTWRFDENSKIIVVDGPVASGKKEFAKKIAEEFDLHHIPHANLDRYYVNSYGIDIRKWNDKIPPKLRSFDPHEFVANPKDERAALMQRTFFYVRICEYIDALSHVLNTGQGVVMNRSIYSDFVFLETYIKFGFLPETMKKHYHVTWNAIKPDLMRPHLVIYLDTPVDVVRENIKRRNNPFEINSPVYQPEVLQEFENIYKQQYLKTISTHAELLVYDWSEEVDPEIVVEDMERINLDDYDQHNPKMHDWRLVDEAAWNKKRMQYSKGRKDIEVWCKNIPCFECPEIVRDGEDNLRHYNVWKTIPGNKYESGYNPDMGDDVLFKL